MADRADVVVAVVLPAVEVWWDRGSERWFAFVLLACGLVCFKRL